jgi:hypothetical protein
LKSFTAAQAARMAETSACAVGSLSSVTEFVPVATTSPRRTTTAPNGPPPSATLFSESAIASSINLFFEPFMFSIFKTGDDPPIQI